jgi:hypothetical protein
MPLTMTLVLPSRAKVMPGGGAIRTWWEYPTLSTNVAPSMAAR